MVPLLSLDPMLRDKLRRVQPLSGMSSINTPVEIPTVINNKYSNIRNKNNEMINTPF